MKCQSCGARIDPSAICVSCGTVDGNEPVHHDVYTQNEILREELMACIATLRGDPRNIVGMRLRANFAEKTLSLLEPET